MGNNPFITGRKFDIAFAVSERDQEAFAQLSGDRNPMHLDAAHARALGFDGAVVYGALFVAKLSQIIGMQAPGRLGLWSSVSMNFRSPLIVGEQATLSAEITQVSEATRTLVMKIAVRKGETLIANGQAMATLFAEGAQA